MGACFSHRAAGFFFLFHFIPSCSFSLLWRMVIRQNFNYRRCYQNRPVAFFLFSVNTTSQLEITIMFCCVRAHKWLKDFLLAHPEQSVVGGGLLCLQLDWLPSPMFCFQSSVQPIAGNSSVCLHDIDLAKTDL